MWTNAGQRRPAAPTAGYVNLALPSVAAIWFVVLGLIVTTIGDLSEVVHEPVRGRPVDSGFRRRRRRQDRHPKSFRRASGPE
ncbi:hypothetical protein CUJ84_Chr002198 [Rhizobium leguminosarum]|uniref:Uncharacterized protein n=1 Tax=Rhizobium leguminosarum TaxID=384 RepID=A0A2K9Z2V6_RHILE|nr:hypothetical protein CUJ84_Chr002198 [Rhizobium leguminosarum]